MTGKEALPSFRKGPIRQLPRASSFKKPKEGRRQVPRRGVSFTTEAPQIERVDSIRNLICEPDSTEEEVKKSLNELWYDEHEIESGKHMDAQLVLDSEANGGDKTQDLRGLERKTEEGGWEHFQHRNNVLGAVLDGPKEACPDALAERASEATEEARKKAHERALQDELETKEYLADIKEYLSKTSDVLPTEDNAASSDEDSDEEDEEAIQKDPCNAPKKKREPLRRTKTMPSQRPDFDWKASARKLKIKQKDTEEDGDGDDTPEKDDDTTPKQENPNSLMANVRYNWKNHNKGESQDDEAAAAILAIKKNKFKRKGLKRAKSMNAKVLMSAVVMDSVTKEAP